MHMLSIVAKDYHTDEQVVGYYNVGDRMKRWGKMGGMWGGIWAVLFGSAFFVIPGIGPLLVAGPLVAWIVGALEGVVVVGGVSALGAGLLSIGIPKDSVLQYESSAKSDKLLLVVNGPAAEVAKAKEVLVLTALEYVKQQFHLQRPLIDENFQIDGLDLFVERYGQLINGSREGQRAMREIKRLS
jgi:hypothetical protein